MKAQWRIGIVAWLVVAAMAGTHGAGWAQTGPPVKTLQIEAAVEADAVRVHARAAGFFDYTTYRPSENLFVVDLAGVSAGQTAGAQVLKSDIVSSYRVLQYRAGDRAIVRVEVMMRKPVEPVVQRLADGHIAIHFAASRGAVAAAPAVNAPARTPATSAARPEASGATLPAGTAIQNIAVERRDNQTQVRVEGNGRLSYETMRLLNPDRLVLDFSGTRARVAKSHTVALEPVKGVRVGQFKPDVARVVIELSRGAAYSVSAEAKSVVVAFGGGSISGVPPAPAGAEKAEASSPAPAPPQETLPALEIKPVVKTPEPPPAPEDQGVREAEAARTMSLPDNLTQPTAGLASLSAPPRSPESSGGAADSGTVVYASGSATPASAVAQEGKYTGEPISVNLKDVDLKDFFRLIHEISGLNVVVDSAVRGTLTIVLDDVPWDQALDIVLQNNNLDKSLDGNVLRITTLEARKREADARRDLDKAKEAAIPTVVRVKTLSYAKATAVRDTLKRFLSSRGEILADERSNSLIMRDIPTVYPDLEDLIRQLDRRTQQVEIEARVVSATRSFARDVGTQFGFATSSTGGRSVYGGLTGVPGFTSPISRPSGLPLPPLVSSGTNQIPLQSNMPAVGPSSGFSFAHTSPNFALDFIISAAESKGVGKLLSKPRVITQNNEKATIKQGSKIPIQTVINNTITVQFIDALLKMEVTPQITADGTIFMEILVDNTQIDNGVPRIQGIPALTTQLAETKVLVNDGGTVVIGGVITTQQRTNIQQVPLFGSIPLIGHLFKRTTVSSDSQELLFFITPRVIAN